MALGWHLGGTSFSGVCLGQKLMKKVAGAGFLVRGGVGWKAKVVLSCKRECKIHDLVFCAPGNYFHTPKLMFAANGPDNWSQVCAFYAVITP